MSRVSSFGQTKRSLLDRLIAYVRTSKIRTLIPRGAQLLDLGCGYNGGLLTVLGDDITSGEGIDISVNPKLKLIQGRVDVKLPFPDRSFDAVTALAIIEHVENPTRMLREIRRVLKPGGRMLITTPAKSGKGLLEAMARLELISREEIFDHKRYYTHKSLALAIANAGFNGITVRHFGILWLNLLAQATT